jgi:hypothetical protein
MSKSLSTLPDIDTDQLIGLDHAQAEAIFNQGKEAVVFALLQLAKIAAEAKADVLPSTPPGMIPVYLKQTVVGPKRNAGAQSGHKGSRRTAPELKMRYPSGELHLVGFGNEYLKLVLPHFWYKPQYAATISSSCI